MIRKILSVKFFSPKNAKMKKNAKTEKVPKNEKIFKRPMIRNFTDKIFEYEKILCQFLLCNENVLRRLACFC
jgi:hypothetical protein